MKHRSLFRAILISLVSIAIYNIYSVSDVFAATASLSTTGSVSIDVTAAGSSANVGTDTLTVNTTCDAGYTVTIQSSTNDATLYKDGDDTSNSRIIPSIGTVSEPASILDNNLGTWGYSMTDSTISGAFIGLNNTPTIIKQSNTASQSGGDEFPVYFGVSVTPQLEAGAYAMSGGGTIVYQLTMAASCQQYTVEFHGNGGTTTGSETTYTQVINGDIPTNLMPNAFARSGFAFDSWNTQPDGTGDMYSDEQAVTNLTTHGTTITLYAIWRCPDNTICYHDNGATTNYGMADQVIAANATSFNLWPPNFKKDNHGFKGWNTQPDGSGDWYGAQQFFDTQTPPITNGLDLYAMWVETSGTMQNWAGCASMSIGDVTALTDNRDNQVYTVAKLADGKCWMTENLKLTTTTVLTSANTHSPISNFAINTSDPNWCVTQNAACYNKVYAAPDNITKPKQPYTGSSANYSYGVYYNWYAATAGRGTYALATANQNTTGSVCPLGWRLPTSGTTNVTGRDFPTMIKSAFGSDPDTVYSGYNKFYMGSGVLKTLSAYPYNFLLSGIRSSTDHAGRGTNGYYWSATVHNQFGSYTMEIGAGTSSATNNTSKANGGTIRCVKI